MQRHDPSSSVTFESDRGATHGTDSDMSSHLHVPTSYAPRTGRRMRFVAGLVAITLVIAFFLVHHIRSDAEDELSSATAARVSAVPPVDVVTVERAPATRPLILPGETAAWYESTIYARVNGYVAHWSVDIGDAVKKGQVMATIDTPDLDDELAAAKAKVKAEESQVKVREAEADFAKTTYERWRDSPKGVVSEQEREAKKAGYVSAVAQLNSAQAQVHLDQAQVDRLTALTQFKQVTAPFDGVVTDRKIDIGNLVTAGSTANTTPLYRVTQDDPIRVFVDVPQAASSDMKPGVPARITASAFGDRKFDGKVTRTSQALDPRARTLRVEVDIPNSDHALVPGMYVQVAFELSTHGLAQIPAGALLFRTSGPQVAVVGGDGVVSYRPVTIARDDGATVELASGVTVGEKVALNISSQIADGTKVAPRNVEQAPVQAAVTKP